MTQNDKITANPMMRRLGVNPTAVMTESSEKTMSSTTICAMAAPKPAATTRPALCSPLSATT
jgi:hypothetical protein